MPRESLPDRKCADKTLHGTCMRVHHFYVTKMFDSPAGTAGATRTGTELCRGGGCGKTCACFGRANGAGRSSRSGFAIVTAETCAAVVEGARPAAPNASASTTPIKHGRPPTIGRTRPPSRPRPAGIKLVSSAVHQSTESAQTCTAKYRVLLQVNPTSTTTAIPLYYIMLHVFIGAIAGLGEGLGGV